MKRLIQSIVVAAVIVIALGSCNKETASTGYAYTSLTDFYNKNGAPVQSFNINSTTASTVTGVKGTVFSFPANIFVNAQNQPVTGTVNITLREIYSNADMILSNKATVANNGTVPLISGGEFYISATQNGSPLHLAPWTQYTAAMPADTLRQNMIAYEGNGAGNTNDDVNWVAANDSAAYIYTQTTPQNEYIYVGDSLNWINCDAVFPGNGTYYSITANPVNCPNVTQTQMFVLVNNQHAIWRLSYTGSQFQTPQDIVSGVPVTIVAVCTSGGKVYSAFTPVTASSNQTLNMNFTVTTDTLFRTQLRAIH